MTKPTVSSEIENLGLIVSEVMLGVKGVVNKYHNPEIAPKAMNDELDKVYHEALSKLEELMDRRVVKELESLDRSSWDAMPLVREISDRIKALQKGDK